jgi:hypothetical protein
MSKSKILSGAFCAMSGVLALLNFYHADGWLQATGARSPAEIARAGGYPGGAGEIFVYAWQSLATVGAVVLLVGGLYHMIRGIIDRTQRGDDRLSIQI